MSQRFNDGGDADSARRLTGAAGHEAGALDNREGMTSQRRTSNKYKRELGDSVSPHRAQGSNERLPVDIHGINNAATDAFPSQGRGAERTTEPHRSERVIVDSIGASTLMSYSIRNAEGQINSGPRAHDADHRSAQQPHDNVDNQHARDKSDEGKPMKYHSLRGRRSASRS